MVYTDIRQVGLADDFYACFGDCLAVVVTLFL